MSLIKEDKRSANIIAMSPGEFDDSVQISMMMREENKVHFILPTGHYLGESFMLHFEPP